ncbi:carboxylate--amine ligase/circularly permuted type 2 ATP-grasp protein [Marisediminicola senii]|uniref:carboxylate--amine ligase/circularly permuted type 2 ATP-grasp protein n=1 Tax=Marisediminicola senii TaxID=2711233 RepID=UPI0013EC7EA2|nr:carboxylate--amine ligase/circularly permuted type 2 ATP-grasp protein [Marisediminicola senii]
MSAELTLGAEEELHLIDPSSRALSARAPQLLAKLSPLSYSAELQRTTVETNTEVVESLSGLRDEIMRLRRGLIDVADDAGLSAAAVGTAPRSAFADFELTTTGRYGRMQEQYRLLVDEQLICGTQVHVGVSDRELAVQIAQRVSGELPLLLALSASSPYWNGQDTGYASIRSLIWQRWPSAGATGPLASAGEYEQLLSDLIDTGVIADPKMAYFEVRPSSHAPTLELRVCDACPIVDDAVLIAGLFRAAVRAAEQDIAAGIPDVTVPAPIHRAAMWQAARGGLSARLLESGPHPRPVPAAQAIREMVDRLRPQLEELGDYDDVAYLTETVLARGNSADRQRAAFAERGELDDVVDLVVRETHGPAGGFASDAPVLRTYRTRAGDEAVGPGARPRAAYRGIVDFYQSLDTHELVARERARERWVTSNDMTFGVNGAHRPFAVDLFPRMLSRYEWGELSAGLTQRARAIEAFLRDVYSERRVIADGIVPADYVLGSPGWRDEATQLPPNTVRAPVMGFDIVRNEFGGWRVLEDNVRDPSGAAYALGIRRLMDAVMPDLPRPPGLLDPETAPAALRDTIVAGLGPDAVAALLTSGPDSSAYFEHRTLAEAAGMPLVEAGDLVVRDGAVWQRGGDSRAAGSRIDALYLRIDGQLVDLVSPAVADDGTPTPIGAQVMAAAAAGSVFLANAPGNGVADDKSLYCYVPELINYYLGEHPLLESVPTYRTSDEGERRIVLERVGELVTKPVDGHGGMGVLIGPDADASQVAERRLEIAEAPTRWVAQEVVALSSLPSFAETALEPRPVELRVFVYTTGTGVDDVRLADLALTRVASEGTLVVDSSRGGGAKDTWVVGPEAST